MYCLKIFSQKNGLNFVAFYKLMYFYPKSKQYVYAGN